MPDDEARKAQAIDELRDLAYRREAEELRKEVVRYVQEGIATKEILATLRPVVQEALQKLMQEALADGRLQDPLGGHMADRVRAEMTKALELAQMEFRQRLKADMGMMAAEWRREATEVLRIEFKEILRKQPLQAKIVQGPPTETPEVVPSKREATETLYQRLPKTLKEQPLRKEHAQGLAQGAPMEEALPVPRTIGSSIERTSPLIGWARPSPWKRRFLPLLASGLVLVLLVTIVIFSLRSSRASDREGLVPQPAASPVSPVNRDRLSVERWLNLMAQAEQKIPEGSPLWMSLERTPYSRQFSCWFNRDTQERLDDIRATALELSENSFQERLATAFDPCVEREYQGKGQRMAVFSTQVAVQELQQRKVRLPPELRDFQADGFAGAATFYLFNTFLKDARFDTLLQITGDSRTEEYLFTLYLALRELEEARERS